MFREARLKLTGWYLLIIMIISFAFSAVIYRAGSFEIERFANAQRMRYERRFETVPAFDHELIEETKQRILTTLMFINLGILTIAGFLGYYLSGKTLQPIQEMMDEQYRFVSDASHELKTPITAIKTTLEVAIRDKKLDLADARETLNTSLDEVNRLQKLADGLLELTHKNIVEVLLPVNLAQVVTTATNMIKSIAERKKIKVLVNVPKVVVMVEESSLTRAIIAILDNAIKYGPVGSKIEVLGKVKSKSIKLSINDQGKGIVKEDIPKVFDRFFRSDLARSESGYGLGLSIAKQIIEEHSGSIEVNSVLDKGTTVKIILPYSARLQNNFLK